MGGYIVRWLWVRRMMIDEKGEEWETQAIYVKFLEK
jgi:hypothetical protein